MKSLALWNSLFAGWVSLVVALAVDFFLMPHEIVSEVGTFAAFLFYGAILSLCFFADFLLLIVPSHVYLRRKIAVVDRSFAVSIGTLLFAISVPVWCILADHMVISDMVRFTVFGAISGFVSFYLLVRDLHHEFFSQEAGCRET